MWYIVAALTGVALASLLWYKRLSKERQDAAYERSQRDAVIKVKTEHIRRQREELTKKWNKERLQDEREAKETVDLGGYVSSGLDSLRDHR